MLSEWIRGRSVGEVTFGRRRRHIQRGEGRKVREIGQKKKKKSCPVMCTPPSLGDLAQEARNVGLGKILLKVY